MKKLFLLWAIIMPFIFCSCGDEKDEPSYPNITLVAGEKYKIDAATSITITSDEPLIASVENGVVTAKRVGETRINVGSRHFEVKVTPRYNTFTEPYMKWGASKSDVKAAMAKYKLYLDQDNTIAFTSTSTDPVKYYQFGFKESKLNISLVYIKSTYVSEALEFIAERYVPVGEIEEDVYAFASVDKKLAVVVQATVINLEALLSISYLELTGSNAPMIELKKTYKNSSIVKVERSEELTKAIKEIVK